MPRHHAILAVCCAFVIGLIVGAVGYHLSGQQTKAVDVLLEENRVLKQMNAALQAELGEIHMVLKEGERTPPTAP